MFRTGFSGRGCMGFPKASLDGKGRSGLAKITCMPPGRKLKNEGTSAPGTSEHATRSTAKAAMPDFEERFADSPAFKKASVGGYDGWLEDCRK